MGSNGKTGTRPVWVVRTLAEVAQFFGRGRDAVKNWRRMGMPGEQGAFDLSEIVRWKEASVGDANRNLAADRGRQEAERQKVWAQAGREQLKLQEEVGQLVPLSVVTREYARHATHSRALFEQFPDRLLGLLPASASGEDKRRFRAEAQKAVEDVIDTMYRDLLERAESGNTGSD